MLAAVTLIWPLPQVFSMPIENVKVKVIDTNSGTSQPLLKKMSDSMQLVAEQLLISKDSEAINADKQGYERLFSEIGDRVFTGYEMQKVNLQPAENTAVNFYLRPWNNTIKETKVDIDFSGLSQETTAMLRCHIPHLEKELAAIMTGASIDAVDWASSILRRQVREKIEAALPEFKAAVDLVQDGGNNNALVQVVVYPVGEAVQSIRYEMHSETVPNIILMRLKYQYAKRCNQLRGLPVEYVKRHQQELSKMIAEELKQEKIIKELALIPRIKFAPGVDTVIDIGLSTEKYKIWLEGYADIARDKDNLSGKAHLGKFISPRDEVFVEEELITDNVHWSTSLGYGRQWGKSTWSLKRRLPEADNVYKLEYRFDPKWGVRIEHFTGKDRNEYALRYRIHEFLSAEYVYGGKESYLRIIGNL